MTTEPLSPDYQRFVESVAGVSPDWRESVDVEALLRLPKDEQRSAIELLIERLPLDDWRAPPALAAVTARGAVGPMKRRLPLANGRMKISIARSLADLEAIPQADEIVAEVLREGDPDSGLVALSAAEEMRSVPIRDALAWACLHHPSPEVRCIAGGPARLELPADLPRARRGRPRGAKGLIRTNLPARRHAPRPGRLTRSRAGGAHVSSHRFSRPGRAQRA
jgi:hypothetical protein